MIITTLQRIFKTTLLSALIVPLQRTPILAQSNQYGLNTGGATLGTVNGYIYEYSLGELIVPAGFGGSSPIIITPGLIQPAVSTKPLPVTLIAFDGETKETYVALKWTSSFEHNSGYFEVERSFDARNWQAIGKVDAIGESHGIAHYSFNDLTPLSGIGYYRLKVADRDASFEYSKIIPVTSGPVSRLEQSLVVYPNPVQRYLTLSVDSKVAIREVRIFDAAGRSVFHRNLDGEGPLDLNQLQTGTYQLLATPVAGAPITRTLIKR